MRVKFQLSSCSSFQDMRGPIFTRGAAPRTSPSGKIFIPEMSTWRHRNVSKIATF